MIFKCGILLLIAMVALLSYHKRSIVKYIFLIFTVSYISSQIYYQHLGSTITEEDIKNYKSHTKALEEARYARMSSSKVIEELGGFGSGPLFSFAASGVVKHKYTIKTMIIELIVSILFVCTLISGFIFLIEYAGEWRRSLKKTSKEDGKQG